MNDKKNEAVRIITALFGGLAGGFFAAVIVLFAPSSSAVYLRYFCPRAWMCLPAMRSR